jgi:thiamine transport system permease protein
VNPLGKIKAWALWALPLLFLGVFFFYPLAVILAYSLGRAPLAASAQTGGFLSVQETLRILAFTLWQALLSTALTLLVGLPGAYLLARYQFRGKSFLQAWMGVPFLLPALVVAACFDALLGPRGWINLGLMEIFGLQAAPVQFTNSIAAILIAHVFYNTTIVLRVVGDFWSRLDRRFGQAAQVLGANRWQILRKVTLPLLAPAILSAALLVFIFDFTSFGVILVLGGPRFRTLEVEIYYQAIGLFNLRAAAALAILQMASTLALTLLYNRLSERLHRPLSLRPQSYNQAHLASWRSRLFAGITVAFLAAFFISPLAALALRSVSRLEPDRGQRTLASPGLTLDFYRELSANRRRSFFYTPPATSISISLAYASATVVLSLALGLPAAWAQARLTSPKWNRVLDAIFMLPLGASAVTLGLGFILAFDQPPLDLRASPVLIPLAHTLVALPFVVRSLTPALRSIKPRLRQAARMMGASPWQEFSRVELPLVSRAILVAAVFAFTISLGEFGATALLARPEYPTIPVAIFRLLSQPGGLNYGQALALSTILMLVSAAAILLVERIRFAENGEF